MRHLRPRRQEPRRQRPSRRGDDRGTATVAVLSLIGVVLLVAAAAAAVLGAAVAHRQAQAAADLAALSGAAAAEQGADPCASARDVARANHGDLAGCRLEGDDVLVTVTVAVPGGGPVLGEVSARARAGPA